MNDNQVIDPNKIQNIQKDLNPADFSVSTHSHNGTDSLKIPAFNIFMNIQSATTANTAPTDSPVDGTQRVLYDATHWVLWIRVNKLWKKVALA